MISYEGGAAKSSHTVYRQLTAPNRGKVIFPIHIDLRLMRQTINLILNKTSSIKFSIFCQKQWNY